MDQKDEIKQKIDLVELIREYVALKAVGINFQALCPFHREKTPSFVVSPERQIWKCFGCGKGGDAFSFVMEIEGLSFVEALRQLAPKAGVTLQRQNMREASQRNRLLDCVEFAVGYFHRVLLEAPEAQMAREYLQGRGLTEAVIEEFKIGYSRESWDDLYMALRKKGVSDEDIFLSGLSVKKERGLGYYNRFRGRIMFPIHDITGNPVAFSARVSPEREQVEKADSPARAFRAGKYINSPQSQIYDKSKILFGLDKAKQFIRQEDGVIVVEGQMDVISSHRAGVKNVVASSGTALSAEQVRIIRRYTKNMLVSFDMDSAGQQAAERGIEQGLRQDMNIRVIQLPGGKDPDECIRTDAREWTKAVAGAVSVMDYYFTQTFTGRDLNDMGQKKAAAAKLLNVILRIANPIEQDSWLSRLADTLMVREDSLRAILRAQALKERQAAVRRRPAVTPPKAGAAAHQSDGHQARRNHAEILTDSLLALALKFFVYFGLVVRAVTPLMLAGERRRLFYKMLVMYYSSSDKNDGVFSSADFSVWLAHNIKDEQDLAGLRDIADTALLLADKDFYDLDGAAAKQQLHSIITQLRRVHLSDNLRRVEQELKAAERSGTSAAVAELMEQATRIINEIKSLNA